MDTAFEMPEINYERIGKLTALWILLKIIF